MNVNPNQTVAALHHPGWQEIGEPDVAARQAEVGPGYYQARRRRSDDWTWERRLTFPQTDGGTLTCLSDPEGNDAGSVRRDRHGIVIEAMSALRRYG